MAETASRNPKVLQIISYASMGGAEKYVLRLTRALAMRGYPCHVITPPGPVGLHFGGLESLGVVYHPLDLRKHPLDSVRRIRALVREQGITLIHSHMYLADLMVFLATFDLKGLTRVSTIHMSIKNQWPASWLRRTQQRLCTMLAFLKYDKVFAVSESMRREVMAYFLLPGRKVATVYNSIDFRAFAVDPSARDALVSRHGLERRAFRIACIGALNRLKSQMTLIRAMGEYLRDLPDVEVYFIGDGYDRALLEAAVERYGLASRVYFMGTQGDMGAWYSLMDAVVLASLTEGLSTSILEAMYMKVPVIASDIPANRELVKEGETGLLFPTKDAKGLASAIRAVHGRKDLAAARAEKAHLFVTGHFGMEEMVEAILAHSSATGSPGGKP